MVTRLEKIGVGQQTIDEVVFKYVLYLSRKASYARIEIRSEGNRIILPARLVKGLNRSRYLKELIDRKSSWISRKINDISGDGGRSFIKLPDQLKKKFYRQAKEEINQIIESSNLSKQYPYKKIYVRDQKTRWGSCSSKGNLSFNWRIILLTNKLKRYLISHELVHLKHSNHSQAFWHELGFICPEAKALDRLLRKRVL